MKTKSILSLIVLFAILCGFNSCVDKPFNPIDDPEYYLCNNRGWIYEYIDTHGFPCSQRLIFYSDDRGTEIFTRYYSNYPDDYTVDTYDFYWDREDYSYQSISMEYKNGDYLLFDQLRISEYWLSGILGDDEVTFEPY